MEKRSCSAAAGTDCSKIVEINAGVDSAGPFGEKYTQRLWTSQKLLIPSVCMHFKNFRINAIIASVE
jgi:hypothetical protein